MTTSFLHYISLFLSVFFVTNKMRLPCIISFYLIYFKTNSSTSLIKVILSDFVLGISSFSVILIFLSFIKSTSRSLYKLILLLGGVSYAFFLFHSPPIRPIFSVLNKLGVTNLGLASLIYLVIILILSYLAMCIDKKIYQFINVKLVRRAM
jgi:hypothetical protein